MKNKKLQNKSPSFIDAYMHFNRVDWSAMHGDWQVFLSAEQIESLRGLNEPLTQQEVNDIYLPLCRLISIYTSSSKKLHSKVNLFFNSSYERVPFVIALAGSVSVGKSTTARVLKALLETGPEKPKVAIVATDGFLYSNAELNSRGLMMRKGFPESYDRTELLNFLVKIKSGHKINHTPVYSHLEYDIVTGKLCDVGSPDILILEGLNVLQPPPVDSTEDAKAHISQFIDFSIYLDATADLLEKWYIERFRTLRDTAFQNPRSFFKNFAGLSDEEAVNQAKEIWQTINLSNLQQNILPTRFRATAVLTKGRNHAIEEVALRRL